MAADIHKVVEAVLGAVVECPAGSARTKAQDAADTLDAVAAELQVYARELRSIPTHVTTTRVVA